MEGPIHVYEVYNCPDSVYEQIAEENIYNFDRKKNSLTWGSAL